jgi:hypothetical protein
LNYELDSNLEGWIINHSEGIFSSPTIFPCFNQNETCIAISVEDGSILIYNSSGYLINFIDYPNENFFWSSITYTGKGLAFIGKNYFYYVFENGTNIPGFPKEIHDWGDSSPAYYDDNDSTGLFVVGGLTQGNDSKGHVYAWWENGTSLPYFPIELAMDTDSSPALVDLNNDSIVEIIIGDDNGSLHAFNLFGQELAGFPLHADNLIEASPSIGRTNPDGEIFISIGSWDSYLYVLNNKGELLDNFPVKTNDQIISSSSIVDITGDGKPEIIVGSKDFGLYAWNLKGEILPFFPINLSASIFSSPMLLDINNNKFIDIVVGANNGIHVIMDVGVSDYSPWPMFRQNPMRNGFFTQ